MNSVLESLDWVVLGVYFLALIGVAVWVILQKNKNTEDYFLAGRNVGWFVIGASIFASNIGSEHVVGLAGTGAESGMPMAHYELHAWIVLLLGWLFLPFYIRSKAFTMPEFLEKRFDARPRWFLSVFSLAGYVVTKVSVTIYAGGIVVSELLGIPFWYGAIGIVIFTGIYTIVGGMKAVIYTETLQTVILIAGSLIITYLGLQEVGGWTELRATVGPDHFNMWRPMSDPDFPWTGLLFGGTVVGVWYWCTDQYIVQRTLAANNIKIGRRGAIFGAYLKILPIFIFLIPGIIAFALAKKGVLTYDKPDVDIGNHCSDPYDCDFKGTCWKHIPDYSVFNISRLNKDKKFDLYNQGVITLDQIDLGHTDLNPNQVLQVQSEVNGTTHIDVEEIRNFTNGLSYPLYYLDFETIGPAVPKYNGSRPYQQLVFQYSLHIQETSTSELEHREYLADPSQDPRPNFIEQLIQDCGSSGDILVYNIGFERGKLNDLIDVFPEYSNELRGIVNRLKDLMIPFQQKWYYTPEMKGSYSIKYVLPALVPELSYNDLDIKEGGTASNTFFSMVNGTFGSDVKETRRQLLEYCKLDTYAMVKILERLFEV